MKFIGNLIETQQELYKQEGITCDFSDFPDNQAPAMPEMEVFVDFAGVAFSRNLNNHVSLFL